MRDGHGQKWHICLIHMVSWPEEQERNDEHRTGHGLSNRCSSTTGILICTLRASRKNEVFKLHLEVFQHGWHGNLKKLSTYPLRIQWHQIQPNSHVKHVGNLGTEKKTPCPTSLITTLMESIRSSTATTPATAMSGCQCLRPTRFNP